jgi:hypothetical protein
MTLLPVRETLGAIADAILGGFAVAAFLRLPKLEYGLANNAAGILYISHTYSCEASTSLSHRPQARAQAV